MAAPEQLRGRSLPELREMLRRQEKLLADRKFISRLPDKGKKISGFVEKLKLAILEEEDRRRTMELLSAVRLEFQEKQQALESSKRKTDAGSGKGRCQDASLSIATSDEEAKPVLQERQNVGSQDSAKSQREPAKQPLGDSIISQGTDTVLLLSPARDNRELSEHPSLCKAENAVLSTSRDPEILVNAFERISIGEKDRRGKTEKGQRFKYRANANPFQTRLDTEPQTPHYIKVLEHRVKNPVVKKSKFKTNLLPAESSGSSQGSTDTPLPGAPARLLPAEERRRIEKQHLDDITAARLPPLHHKPSQLLPVEESIAIQIKQKEAYEEMQAKLAAQKLSERLGLKMVRYEPEGKMAGDYREVRDEEGYSSGED